MESAQGAHTILASVRSMNIMNASWVSSDASKEALVDWIRSGVTVVLISHSSARSAGVARPR